jgi:hypothetical protein
VHYLPFITLESKGCWFNSQQSIKYNSYTYGITIIIDLQCKLLIIKLTYINGIDDIYQDYIDIYHRKHGLYQWSFELLLKIKSLTLPVCAEAAEPERRVNKLSLL